VGTERKASAKMSAERKNFEHPDETRSFEKGKVELLRLGGGVVGRLTLESGWRWSKHVRPIGKTEWCEAPHFHYQLAGRLHIRSSCGIGTTMHPCPPRCSLVKYGRVFARLAPCGQGASLPQSGGFAASARSTRSKVNSIPWSRSKHHTNF
jgi:hypothetical protein